MERLRVLDYVQYWFSSGPGLIIPMPEILLNNVDAIIKPFQFWVKSMFFEALRIAL